MTRYVVVRESEKVPSGLYIRNGAIQMLDPQVPLHLNFRYDEEAIGRASDFQRDGDEISMDIEFNDRWHGLFHDESGQFRSELWEFSMYCTDLISDPKIKDDVQVGMSVTSCRLRGISVIPIMVIPKTIRWSVGG